MLGGRGTAWGGARNISKVNFSDLLQKRENETHQGEGLRGGHCCHWGVMTTFTYPGGGGVCVEGGLHFTFKSLCIYRIILFTLMCQQEHFNNNHTYNPIYKSLSYTFWVPVFYPTLKWDRNRNHLVKHRLSLVLPAVLQPRPVVVSQCPWVSQMTTAVRWRWWHLVMLLIAYPDP